MSGILVRSLSRKIALPITVSTFFSHFFDTLLNIITCARRTMNEKSQVHIEKIQANKTGNTHKSNIELLRIRVISASEFQSGATLPTPVCRPIVSIPKLNPSIEAIYPTPNGDAFMCPLNNGQIKVVTLSSIQFAIGPKTYFCNLQSKVDGEYCSMENSVTDFSFSPFVEKIFLVSWSSGDFALFHQSEALPSITWDIWDYMEPVKNRRSHRALDDSVISIRWDSRNPCVFFVLTKESIMTFDLLQGKSPYQSQRINHHDTEESPNIIPLGLVTGFSKKSLPRLVTTNALERELRTMELNFFLFKDGYPSNGTKDGIEALKNIVLSKAFI